MDSLTHFHSRNVYFYIHYSNSLKSNSTRYVSKKIGFTPQICPTLLPKSKIFESESLYVCVVLWIVPLSTIGKSHALLRRKRPGCYTVLVHWFSVNAYGYNYGRLVVSPHTTCIVVEWSSPKSQIWSEAKELGKADNPCFYKHLSPVRPLFSRETQISEIFT